MAVLNADHVFVYNVDFTSEVARAVWEHIKAHHTDEPEHIDPEVFNIYGVAQYMGDYHHMLHTVIGVDHPNGS